MYYKTMNLASMIHKNYRLALRSLRIGLLEIVFTVVRFIILQFDTLSYWCFAVLAEYRRRGVERYYQGRDCVPVVKADLPTAQTVVLQ